MKSLNKLFIVLLIFIAVFTACEVGYYEPLQSYVESVANGRTIQVSISDNVISSDNFTIDFGYELIDATPSSPQTITIENIGQIDMTVTTISLDTGGIGNNPFVLDYSSMPLPYTLSPDDTAEFSVVFQPSVLTHEGQIDAVITIGSSDEEYGNFTIDCTGYGDTGQTLQVNLNDIEIDDDSSAADFNSIILGNVSTAKTITLINAGHENLTIDSIELETLTGNPFAINTSGVITPFTLVPAEEKEFTIVFQPSLEVTHETTLNAEIVIGYTDSESSDFIINVQGTGTQLATPEVTVKRAGVDFISDDTIYNYGSIDVGVLTPPNTIFEISNTGTANLVISGINLTDNTNYSFSDLTTSYTLAPGDVIYKTITFDPQSGGVKEAILSIPSTDSDENPFVLKLTGTGVASPELTLKSGTTEYFHNSTPYTFDSRVVDTNSTSIQFTIFNEGSSALNITTVTLGDTTNYTLGSSLNETSIVPGGSSTFTLAFTPQTTGSLPTTITIDSDDPEDDPFILSISGEATATPLPEISVLRSASDYESNVTTYDYGNILKGQSQNMDFQIKNSGSANLVISGINITNATNYSFSDSSTSANIAPGDSIYKTITFSPTSTGTLDASLSVFSNDADENPFILKLTGIGVTPEIEVTEGATTFTNGGAASDFEYQKLNETSGVKIYTIENTGTYPLTISNVVLSAGVNDYSMSPPSTPFILNPAETETFTVSFTPLSESVITGAVTIGSNDQDDTNYILNLTGEGDTGELTVLVGTTEYNCDDCAVYFVIIGIDAGPTSKDIILRNDGNVDLQINNFIAPSSPFSQYSGTAGTISAGNSMIVTLRFDPETEGGFGDSFIINTDDLDESVFTLNIRGGTNAPTLVASPYIWLDAKNIRLGTDTVNETDQINGGTKDYVTKWPDFSTGEIIELSSFNAVERNNAETNSMNAHTRRLPEYYSNVEELNGQPALRFRDDDGLPEYTTGTGIATGEYYNGDVLYIPGIGTYLSEFTVITIMRPKDFMDSGGRTYLYGSNTPYLRVYDSTTDFYNGFPGVTYYSEKDAALNNTFSIINRIRYWNAESDFSTTDSYRFWANGSEEINTNSDPLTSYTNQIITGTRRFYQFTLGNHNSNFRTYAFSGYVPEFIVYQEALSDEAIEIIHNYLNEKYTIW
ncbi:MAG: choice-of-anchor D domain-containing protein [Spirochaetales bacterium]|nr:choice-of-anchor D domain-containing protein [Spirochaetales bacterium]